jgi:L-fucose isomerase-like protein
MTWWEPTEVPKLAKTVKKYDFDLVVVFSATHGTVRCISSVVKLFHLPAVIWAIPIRYSLATSAIANSYLRERGYHVRLLCNSPIDESVRNEVETAARSAQALKESTRFRIGIVGNLSPLMISIPYDPVLLKRKLGPTIIKIGMDALGNSLKSVTHSDLESELSKIESKYPVKVARNTLSNAARFQLAVRKLVEGKKLDAIALECWTNLFPKYGVNPCLGHLDDLVVGCEGDIVSASGALILKAINGVNPYLTDILSVDKKTNMIELSHCAAPVSLAVDQSEIKISERTDKRSAGKTAFVNFKFKTGPATLVRFYGRRLNKIHMTFGELKNTGSYWGGISPIMQSRGNAAEFLENASGNHYLLTYGDLRKELRLFAEWRGLEVLEN